MRENDVVLRQRSDAPTLYCVKCGFTGSVERVNDFYTDARKKYLLLSKKITLEELRRM